MSKFPNEIRLLISWAMPLNREWNVEIVMNHFKQELESREICRFLESANLELRTSVTKHARFSTFYMDIF